jgi:alpha/beta superfamily hydrolase
MPVPISLCRRSFRRETLSRLVALYVVLVAVHSSHRAAHAASSKPCCPRPQDQVWLVSNRGLGCNIEQQVQNLKYWRYDCERSWVRSSLAELLAADDGGITTVFVHGNRITCDEAFTKGWGAYRTLVRCADERPVRFIIWSWPSDPIRGPVQDAREKACRTNPSGYCLGWFLDRLNPETPVSLMAHSFGARIVTGALHVLGGGQIDGHRLDERNHPIRQAMPVVLLVAALDNDWLMPGRYHGQAMSQVSSMLLVNNSCDMLLKRYHRIYGRRCSQQALGFTGLASWAAGVDWTKVSQVNAASIVGRRHSFAGYIGSSDLVARMRPHLFFESAPQAKVALSETHQSDEASTGLDEPANSDDSDTTAATVVSSEATADASTALTE